MAMKGRTLWILTGVNVLAAVITVVVLAYMQGYRAGEQQANMDANTVNTRVVVPNTQVGQGHHPTFDCSALVRGLPKPSEGMAAITALANNTDQYKDKPVAVRAVVVQAYPQIMGVNWFHLCDEPNGSVLVVSSNEWIDPGHEVVVRGTLSINRNIEGAYTFPLYIENGDLVGEHVRQPKGVNSGTTYDL